MIHPRRLDGKPLHVIPMPDGRVFVDPKPELAESDHYAPYNLNRGGPEHSRHFHRFEDYGLADGLVRCRKCGLVKENNDRLGTDEPR